MRGVRLGLPVFLGYVPVGAAFGLAAVSIGFSATQTTACSALVFAGAGQFIAVNALRSGDGAIAALIATGVVNLRHLLFSATLAPHLRGVDRPTQALLAFTLTDEVFAVNISDLRAGRADRYSMLGVGVISWTGWLLGTVIGALAGAAIGDPSKWGVEFAMSAMFVALLVGQITGRREIVAAALAAGLALALTMVLPGMWPVVVGAIVAATIMTAVSR
ncbi:MAG: AzlC family ABC transporter permease [Coriobacteriia bacterium]|nr:AzlC family ABC transporter permease [Coriobacteriia bacterium]